MSDETLSSPIIPIININETGYASNNDPSNIIKIKAPNSATSHTLTLPPTNASGVLTNDGTGTLSWGPGGGGVNSLQDAYNGGSTIVLDSVENAIEIIDNATPIAGNLFEIQDNTSSNLFSVSTSSIQMSVNAILKSSLQLEDPGVGTDKISIQAPTLGSDYTLILPSNTGAINQFLQTDGSGNLTWATGSTITSGTGLSFTGSTINANATNSTITMNANDFSVNVGNNFTGGLAWSGNQEFTGTTFTTNLTGQLALESTLASSTAIDIDASDTSGGINISSGSGGITLDTTGEIIFRDVSTSGITKLIHGSVNTSDGSATVLTSFISNINRGYKVIAEVVCRRTDSGIDETNAYELRATYKNNTGSLVLTHTPIDSIISEEITGYDCTLDISGPTLRILVTGAVGNNVSWNGSLQIKEI